MPRSRSACDLYEERLEHMKQLYPSLTTTTDYKDIIKDEEY